jgi:hypothetical protein
LPRLSTIGAQAAISKAIANGANRLTRIETNSSPPAARLTLAARSG